MPPLRAPWVTLFKLRPSFTPEPPKPDGLEVLSYTGGTRLVPSNQLKTNNTIFVPEIRRDVVITLSQCAYYRPDSWLNVNSFGANPQNSVTYQLPTVKDANFNCRSDSAGCR